MCNSGWLPSVSKIAILLLLTLLETTCSASPKRFCGDRDSWNSTTLPYSFSNDAWGDDGSGSSCLQVNDNGSSFDVTYQWRENYYKVHGYPHMKLESQLLPLQINNLSSLHLKATWSTNVATAVDLSAAKQAAALDESRVRSNVAIDMFLDPNKQRSVQFRPSIEVMIWLWSGKGIDPVGVSTSNPDQQQMIVDGMRFFLYQGLNSNGQSVFSWLPQSNVTKVDSDFAPLIHYLWQENLISSEVYLGSIQFGSETFFAYDEAIFSASDYDLSVDLVPNGTSSIPPVSTPSPVPRTGAGSSIPLRKSLVWATTCMVLGGMSVFQ